MPCLACTHGRLANRSQPGLLWLSRPRDVGLAPGSQHPHTAYAPFARRPVHAPRSSQRKLGTHPKYLPGATSKPSGPLSGSQLLTLLRRTASFLPRVLIPLEQSLEQARSLEFWEKLLANAYNNVSSNSMQKLRVVGMVLPI
jgi:hypothetical protein